MSKILIVDDSATMRKIIMRVLRQAGLKVETVLEASNGAEGMERLAADPSIDVILSDVNMPVMNGIDFLKAVRESHAKEALPVVMITTEGGDAMLQTAMDSGANGYLTKPFTPEGVQAILTPFLG